jgi:hypothetical protein
MSFGPGTIPFIARDLVTLLVRPPSPSDSSPIPLIIHFTDMERPEQELTWGW